MGRFDGKRTPSSAFGLGYERELHRHGAEEINKRSRLYANETELALVESFARDIAREMLNADERGSGHATTRSAS